MKLGNLFKGLIEVAALPVAASIDILSGGLTMIVTEDERFFTTKLLDQAKEDLNKATE